MNELTATPYKISTITATGSINTLIDLQILYDYIEIVNVDSEDIMGCVYIEYGKNKVNTISKGINVKAKQSLKRKKKDVKRFDNQSTLLIKNKMGEEERYINTKIFKNGNVQMTGLKTTNQGICAVNFIIKMVHNIYKINQNIVEDIQSITNNNFRIRLINSDFKLNTQIKRDKLNVIIQERYGIYSSFEPCIYPGVKVQYYWNIANNKGTGTGICNCTVPCNGKGQGLAHGDCKRITIAIFQSGCIIITGAQTTDQIKSAYDFVFNVIKDNLYIVQKSTCAFL